MVNQWHVKLKKINQSTVKPTLNHFIGHMMAAMFDTPLHTPNRQLGGSQCKKYKIYLVPLLTQLPKTRCKRPGCQCGFKGKIHSLFGQFRQTPKHDATGFKRHGLWSIRR